MSTIPKIGPVTKGDEAFRLQQLITGFNQLVDDLGGGTGIAVDWDDVYDTPTTLAGYGILDGVSSTASYDNPTWLNSLAGSKITGAVGIADEADALSTPRNFSISGDGDAIDVLFDGTGDVDLVIVMDAIQNNITSIPNLTVIGTIATGAVPASLVTAGTFGTGAYIFPSTLVITTNLTVNGNTALGNAVGDTTTISGPTTVGGTLGVTGQLNALGALVVFGNTTFGDAITDSVSFSARIASDVLPITTATYSLGAGSRVWANGFFTAANITTITTTTVNAAGTVTAAAFSTSGTLSAASLTLTGNLSVQGNTTLGNATSDTITVTGRMASALEWSTDNSLDIGASGANRPRRGYFGTELLAPLVTAASFVGALTGNASTATNVAWSGVTGTPTTIAGYGITDFVSLGDAQWVQLDATSLPASIVTSSLTTIGTLVAGAVPASLVTAGTFSTGNYAMEGNLFLGPASFVGSRSLTISAAAGNDRSLLLQTGGLTRWQLSANNVAEGGSNAGSSLQLQRYDDAGAVLATVLYSRRQDGRTILGNSTTMTSNTMFEIIAASSDVALVVTDSSTNTSSKNGRIATKHYTNAEEPLAMMFGRSLSTTNLIDIGGGSSQMNAATTVSIYTAANNTTVTGTLRASWDSAGVFAQVGNATVGGTLGVSGIATVQGLTLNNSTQIIRSTTTSLIAMSGGSSTLLGGSIRIYGEAHATQADDIEFRTATTVRGMYDASVSTWIWTGAVTMSSTLNVTTSVTSASFIGALTGNADTVTNGVYTTGSYADPAWITSLAGSKITGNIDNVVIGATTAVAGTFTTLTATGAVSLSPANANVVLSPTGTGLVTINPTAVGSLNNVVIGGSTPLAATFTTLVANTSVMIGSTTAATGSPMLDIVGALGIVLSDVTTNATTKISQFAQRHYTNSEEPIALIAGSAGAAFHTLYIGGGISTLNSTSRIQFFVGATYTSLTGTLRMQIGVAEIVMNEDGLDYDFRVESDALAHMLFIEATASNLGLFSNTAPNFQSGERIIHMGNRNAVPTANPANGGFLYADAGSLVWRGSGGTVTTVAPA